MIRADSSTFLSILTATALLGCNGGSLASEPVVTGTPDGGDPTATGAYRLVAVSSIASPLPDPTGIAADASGLWLMNGGHNSETHTLVHFDPATGVTDRSFTFTNLIEQLGTGVYGITYDGVSVWITVAGNTNKLVLVDPTTGQITRTMSSPTELGPSDLDYDGTDLWLSSGTGTIFQLDHSTGGIKRQFATGAASAGRDTGVAYRPGQLWVGDLFGGMEVQDPTTGAVIATATHDDGSTFTQDEMGPSCFVGGRLVMASSYGIRSFDAVTSVRAP